MRTSTKRLIAVAATTVVLLGGAGIAYAYWTAGGTGTGSGTTGSSEDIEVNQSSVITNLRPGATAQTLSGTFTNDNDEPIYVGTVTASIASVTGGAGLDCDADDYTLTGAIMTVGVQVAVGDPSGTWSGATIAFNNSATENQDDCQGATVNFSYVVGD